jgi:hypothetical protein
MANVVVMVEDRVNPRDPVLVETKKALRETARIQGLGNLVIDLVGAKHSFCDPYVVSSVVALCCRGLDRQDAVRLLLDCFHQEDGVLGGLNLYLTLLGIRPFTLDPELADSAYANAEVSPAVSYEGDMTRVDQALRGGLIRTAFYTNAMFDLGPVVARLSPPLVAGVFDRGRFDATAIIRYLF